LRFSRSLLVIVLFFIIITCAYLFLKKNKTHTFIFTANSDNNNMRNTLSPPRFPLHLLQKSSLLLLLPFFSVLSLSPLRAEEEEEVFRCWRVWVLCCAHIFFNQKIHKGPQGGTEKGKKGEEERRESTKEEGQEGKKKILKKRKSSSAARTRERGYIHFQPTKFLSRPNDLSWPSKICLSRAFPRCLCSFF